MPYINLPVVTPTYTGETLTLKPSRVAKTSDSFLQVLNDTDGGNPKVVTMSTTPQNIVKLTFEQLTKAEYDTLNSLYNSSSKAYGMANSFVWVHPETGNSFTVHFRSDFDSTLFSYGKYNVSFTLKVLGTPT